MPNYFHNIYFLMKFVKKKHLNFISTFLFYLDFLKKQQLALQSFFDEIIFLNKPHFQT